MFKSGHILRCCFLAITLTVAGCQGLRDTIATHKVSEWRKGNVVIEGRLNRIANKRKYYRIYVGAPKKHAKALPSIQVQWPNGQKVLLSQLEVSDLIEMANVDKVDSVATFPDEGPPPRAFWSTEYDYYNLYSEKDARTGFVYYF